jgi:hypothetical protein
MYRCCKEKRDACGVAIILTNFGKKNGDIARVEAP